MKKKLIAITITFIFLFTCFSTVSIKGLKVSKNSFIKNEDNTLLKKGDGNQEYWGLMIGVDCYQENTERLSFFAIETTQIYNTLLVSSHWKKENIELLLDEQATKSNIINGFNWIQNVADEDDFVVITYNAHGGQLSRDYFPIDEEDGKDECLTTYKSKLNPLELIRDDLFSSLIKKVKSKNICVIITSCHSGGMPDLKSARLQKIAKLKNFLLPTSESIEEKWMKSFSNDIKADGMVILMSCREDESCYGYFREGVNEGLQGYGDYNQDGKCSAEEAFEYAYQKVTNNYWLDNTPMIIDNYPGEFFLTYNDLPPSKPTISIVGPRVIKENEITTFSTVSTDPENDKIRYGFSWNEEDPDFDYYFGFDEWTELYKSGEICKKTHFWNNAGVYQTSVRSQDEYGAEKIYDHRSEGCSVIVHTENEVVDQYQAEVIQYPSLDKDSPVAQSFKPNVSTLTKIKIKFLVENTGETYNVRVSVREKIDGNNIQTSIFSFETTNDEKINQIWKDIVFNQPVNLIEDNTYFFIVETDYEEEGWLGIGEFGGFYSDKDSYPQGCMYALNWDDTWYNREGYDLGFVTYE